MASPLSPETRAATLAALSQHDVDLLVIGGGITGAGIARDAALRGLSTVLVERTDFAGGTSSRSSKLIHGGVRYLEQGDIGLVREAANERQVLRGIAPHLAEPRLMVMPTYRRTTHAKLGIGLWTFEKIATVPADEKHHMWGRAEALEREPLLAGQGLHGAAAFVEYLTDDARLVIATVLGAHAAGALVANHAEVIGLARAGERTAVRVRDALGGAVIEVGARIVVNAAGPWVDRVRELAGAAGGSRLRLTKGIHLTLAHERLPIRNIVVMQARDRRSVFAVPRDGVVYVGTTDTDFGAPADYPEVTAADVDYLLEATNRTFAVPPVVPGDVIGSWAGLRPLIHEEGKKPSEISRKDEIMTDGASGLVSIAGGKLTTYRTMAQRIVDLVCERVRATAPCRTGELPLPGGDVAPAGLAALVASTAARLPGLPGGAAERLVRLYGTAVERIVARVATDPGAATALPGLAPVPRAEVEHVLDEEMALTLTDVLERRLRVLLFAPGQGIEAAEAVAALCARRLGWDGARTAAEIEGYRRLAASARSFA